MEKARMEYFRKKLIKEKDNVYSLLKQMEDNEVFNSKVEMASELSELSMYDNHPADVSSELFELEKGRALREHELTIIKKIDDCLNDIENGNYGSCSKCGVEIPEERLEFIPYTEYCVNCQEEINSLKPREKNNRPIEEAALGNPFGYGYNDIDEEEEVGFDAEDSYQEVNLFNKLPNIVEYYFEEDEDNDGFVEPIERISNQQYESQLPD